MSVYSMNPSIAPSFMFRGHFARGVRTGTLYWMISPSSGYVIAGHGDHAGREGKLHTNKPQDFIPIPVGSVVTITI